MAIMIPDRNVEDFGNNQAELDVYRTLSECFPDNVTVIHGYEYTANVNFFFKDGEVDFIVLIPGVGTCFLEVKGARRFRYIDAAWHRCEGVNFVEMDDPFSQAKLAKYNVTNLVKQHLNLRHYPGRFAHLVIFPRGELEGAMPAAYDRSLLVTQSDMPNLASRINDAIIRATSQPYPFTPNDANNVAKALTSAGELVPLVTDEVDQELIRIENMTREQHVTAHALHLKRVVVHGPAGSGKTMLAVSRAISDQERTGGKVLLTCFNKNLAEWLKRYLKNYLAGDSKAPNGVLTSGIHVHHFHELCSMYINRIANRTADWNQLSSEKDFWKNLAPILLDEVVDPLPAEYKFDSIVVDEGQDFEDIWLLKLHLLLKNRSKDRFMLCLGDGQRLFTSERQVLQNCDAVIKLRHNCRNTKSIATFAAKAGDVEAELFTRSPQGDHPIVRNCGTTETQARNAIKMIDDWLKSGLKPNQIAILSPFRFEPSMNATLTKIEHLLNARESRFQFTDNVTDWSRGQAIWRSTIRSFKGMESDCVILLDVSSINETFFTRDDLYVGISRARSRLVLLTPDPKMTDYLKGILQEMLHD